MKTTAHRKLTSFLILSFLFFLFYALVSPPILHAGFLSDDILNSLIIGALREQHLGLFQYSFNAVKGWFIGSGRIYPLGTFLQYPVFYIFHANAFYYELFRFIFILLNIMLGGWLVFLMTKNKSAAIFFLFIAPLFWSIRMTSDPLISYALLLPGLVLFIFLSLGLFIRYHESRKKCFFIFSILFYALALLTYELGITTFFMVLIHGWFKRNTIRQFLYDLSPYFFLTLLYVIATLIARHHLSHLYDGVTLGTFNMHAVKIFFAQLTGALPLSYGIFAGHLFKLTVLTSYFDSITASLSILILFSLFWGMSNYFIARLHLSKKDFPLFISMGLVLNIIPSLFMAGTQKYQNILTWGLAYLPVYLQYFGMAFILLCLLSCIQKTNTRYIISTLLALTLCLSVIFNAFVVKTENSIWMSPRNLIISSFQKGLLGFLPSQAVLMTKEQFSWSSFYLQYGNMKVPSLILTDPLQLLPQTESNATQTLAPDQGTTYTISGEFQRSPTGFTLLQPKVNIDSFPYPLYFLEARPAPFTHQGEVLLGQVVSIQYTTTSEPTTPIALTLVHPVLFSTLTNTINALAQNQVVHITWTHHCAPLKHSPPFYSLTKGHPNEMTICKIP